MKLLIYILLFLSISGSIIAQELNQTIIDERSGQKILISYCDRNAFRDTSFAWWFNSEQDLYEVDSAITECSWDKLKDTQITIVMGTWCSDSRREVPRFYKILDYLDYPSEKITLINVDRNKVGLADEVKDLQIEFVPTFIIYSNEDELGRIIETPMETLERDLCEILKKVKGN
ncbi:MAG: thioredoxin family protein [Melioribacteraceae bacterium]|nr:thioredoxin family protein [Melioribacteraceae bacterium]MCF8353492.1 thioredoxin family protein [Melioribacteraceae bacterium]MCF8392621.1 thioredoxin family protein [Melioribacteraceae bacterium]MCF8418507.1 thioredoxin family protein [Melioribacteraceae bacterium]